MSFDVSVVMGVHNGAEWLTATLDSIASQEGVSFEAIIIDDGSTDSSGELLDRFAAEQEHVRVIHQENRGLTESLRIGCDIARGTYIARQDAGDTSHPLRLVRQKTVLDGQPAVVFVSCWTRYVGPAGEDLWTAKDDNLPDSPVSLIDLSKEWGVIGGPTSHPSVMMRRDAYVAAGGYRTEFYFGQDWDLWYRLAEIGRFQMVHEPLYIARISPESISAGWREPQMRLASLSLAAMRARLEGRSESAILDQATAIRPQKEARPNDRADGLYFIGEALRRRGNSAGRRYLREAVAARPWMFRAWLRLLQSYF